MKIPPRIKYNTLHQDRAFRKKGKYLLGGQMLKAFRLLMNELSDLMVYEAI